MPKAIAHPTDSRLLEKSRQHLVKVADHHGLSLRQNYNRIAPTLVTQIGRYPWWDIALTESLAVWIASNRLSLLVNT